MSKIIEFNSELKNTGIIKKIDELGRLVLPSTLRGNYEIRTGDKIQIHIINNFILLRKQGNNKEKEKVYFRKVDELGRIVIPIEIRKNFDLSFGSPIEIYIANDYIVLKKLESSCTFCNSKQNLIEYKDKLVCSKCIHGLACKTNS